MFIVVIYPLVSYRPICTCKAHVNQKQILCVCVCVWEREHLVNKALLIVIQSHWRLYCSKTTNSNCNAFPQTTISDKSFLPNIMTKAEIHQQQQKKN